MRRQPGHVMIVESLESARTWVGTPALLPKLCDLTHSRARWGPRCPPCRKMASGCAQHTADAHGVVQLSSFCQSKKIGHGSKRSIGGLTVSPVGPEEPWRLGGRRRQGGVKDDGQLHPQEWLEDPAGTGLRGSLTTCQGLWASLTRPGRSA